MDERKERRKGLKEESIIWELKKINIYTDKQSAGFGGRGSIERVLQGDVWG